MTSTRVSPVAMNDTRMKHHNLAVKGIRKVKNDWLLDGFFIRIPEANQDLYLIFDSPTKHRSDLV